MSEGTGQDCHCLLTGDEGGDPVEVEGGSGYNQSQSLRQSDCLGRHCGRSLVSGLRGKATHWRSATVAALRGWIKQEFVALTKLTVPVILTLFFHNLSFFVALLCVGNITGTSLELDSVALAFSFVSVTGVSIGIGLATACDTLCAQAFGYKNYKRVGIVLQRGILILTIAAFPIWALWLNAESFLLLIQQKPCVARLTGQYVRVYCIALPFIFLYFLLQQYLQAQGIVWMFVGVGFLANIINAALHGVLVFWIQLGVQGAAISLVITNVAAPLMTIVYTRLWNLHRKTWGGWTWESLREWGLFTKLGIPGLFMICFEWWAVEVVTFVAGSISETELAINSILLQPLIIMFMVPLGISIAISIRVGNELGAGNPKGAKRACYVAFGIVLVVTIVYIVLLQATKNYIGQIFTKDKEVIEGVSKIMDVACFFIISDQIQVTVAGILRGSGRQYLGAVINFICYYIIGLPVGISLALKADMGARGLWIGLAAGNVMQAVLALVVFFTTNWEKESQKAMKRAQGSAAEAIETRREDSSLTDESDSQSELQNLTDAHDQEPQNETDQEKMVRADQKPLDKTDMRNQNEANMADQVMGKESSKAPDSVSVCSSDSSSTLDNMTGEKMEEVPLQPRGGRSSESPCDHLEGGDEEEGRQGAASASVTVHSRKSCKTKTTLLLYRGAFFVIGLAIVVGGGVSGRYHPHVGSGNYTECSDAGANSSDSLTEQSLVVTFTVQPTVTHSLHEPTPSPVITSR